MLKRALILLSLVLSAHAARGASCEPELNLEQALARAIVPEFRDNALYSPYNLRHALALLWPATSGEARRELGRLLGIRSDDDLAFLEARWTTPPGPVPADESAQQTRFKTSASLWPNARTGFTLNAEYVAFARRALRAHVEAVDFGAPDTLGRINGFVAEQTEGLIPNLLTRLDPGADLALITTLFIEGRWAVPFNPAATHPAGFTPDDGESLDVPMMSLTKPLEYGEAEGFRVVRLWTGDGRAAVEFALPRGPGASAEFLERGPRVERFKRAVVSLSLPKFRLSWTGDVTRTLGRVSPALLGADALGGLGEPAQRVSQAIHAAELEVHEFGFKGAAATAIITTRGMGPRAEVELRFDRSFGVRVITEGEQELFRGWVDRP